MLPTENGNLSDFDPADLKEHSDRWARLRLSTASSDRGTAEEGIAVAYIAAGYPPPQHIEWAGRAYRNRSRMGTTSEKRACWDQLQGRDLRQCASVRRSASVAASNPTRCPASPSEPTSGCERCGFGSPPSRRKNGKRYSSQPAIPASPHHYRTFRCRTCHPSLAPVRRQSG